MVNHRLVSDIKAPVIPGLRFRFFYNKSDLPKIVAVMSVSDAADGVDYAVTLEDVENAFDHLSHCDPDQDFIFAEINGDVIAFAWCSWYSEVDNGPYLYNFQGAVAPQWRRQGIGQALLGWLENRLQTISTEHPAERPKFFQVFTSHGQTGLATMLEREGYTAVRYSDEMVRQTLDNIPGFPMPEGLEVRPVLPEHYRIIWETANEAAQDHWGSALSTEKNYQAWLNNKTVFQPHLWQIAWDMATDQIAGQVRTYINHTQNEKYDRKRGFTEYICVRRPWRRRGLAKALIALSLTVQKEQGMTESTLRVDSENLSGANRLYETCGFRVVKRHSVYRKPLYS